MVQFRTKWSVFIGTCCVVVVAAAAMLVHVQINYEPELRPVVRPRALTSTILVAFPIAFFFLRQMYNNFLLTEELQRLVNRDRLTDVATRDFFYARMEQSPWAYGVSLMVDIDHFKKINDTYGHPAGDRVIAKVAERLTRFTRAEDIVCRYGGEEFVIFLFDRGRIEGLAVAERMRQEIAQMPMGIDGVEIGATVSIGGSLKERIAHIDDAIKEADAALYKAKAGGRNQVIFPDDVAPMVVKAS